MIDRPDRSAQTGDPLSGRLRPSQGANRGVLSGPAGRDAAAQLPDAAAVTDWWCPQCDSAARTYDSRLPMHPCHGLGGLMTPLIPVTSKGESRKVEREDYVGRQSVQLDTDNRPVMSVVTTRDDGEDCTIYAPCVSMAVKGTE